MNWGYLYLLLDIFAISVPLACSFYPKARFATNWRVLPFSIGIPATIFIVWDVLFTHWGVWGFNDRYLTGVKLLNLPLEEWLFFLCIPYACTFTYFAFLHIFRTHPLKKAEKPITWTLLTGAFLTAIFHLDKAYTFSTFALLGIFLLMHLYLFKSSYLGRFYFTFIFILIPFFLINGVLTGSAIEDQVVWYNDAENLGIRIGTIPVEDLFYGMLLILMNITIFERLRIRSHNIT